MTAAPALPKIAHGDLTKDLDLTSEELFALLDLASDVKRSPEFYRSALAGKSIALLFEKPSLRTRMTFELAIQQLGGFALVNEGRIGVREPLKDMARNLDRWVSAIVARTFLQKTVDGLAHWSKVPVINALSDMYHPCQALADMQTVREHFGTPREHARHQARVRRRRQQHGEFADAERGASRHGFRAGHAEEVRSEPGDHCRNAGAGRALGLEVYGHERSGRSRSRRARDLYRRMGQHGRGK